MDNMEVEVTKCFNSFLKHILIYDRQTNKYTHAIMDSQTKRAVGFRPYSVYTPIGGSDAVEQVLKTGFVVGCHVFEHPAVLRNITKDIYIMEGTENV